ncbi:MAG TPA: DUF3891 family protein [Candidatus Angelobacter sp.]|nr:DUF3891 family protein [Candidatus Angelobacter sp.]
MILRPLELLSAASAEFLSAWSVVERIQREPYDACWMITQPSHAVLAGDFAAQMTCPNLPANVPKMDPTTVRAIALHDAGWGIPDAQAIMQSRSVRQGCPKSFIQCSTAEFLAAWDKSIEVAASTGPAGGYIVSRHFVRIAEQNASHVPPHDRDRVSAFLHHEAARQKQLSAKQERSTEELELLTDVLQFCDLLSLYVCCGAQGNAVFPEYFGVKARLTMTGNESYKLEPALIEPGTFKVAALRHPATRGESSREIDVRIW